MVPAGERLDMWAYFLLYFDRSTVVLTKYLLGNVIK